MESGCVWVLGHKQENTLKEIKEHDIQDDNNIFDESAKLIRLELISQLRIFDNKIESLCR